MWVNDHGIGYARPWDLHASTEFRRRVEVYSHGVLQSRDAPIIDGTVTDTLGSGMTKTLDLVVPPSWLQWFDMGDVEVRPWTGLAWGHWEELCPHGVFPVPVPDQTSPTSALVVKGTDRWQVIEDYDFDAPFMSYAGGIRDILKRLVNEVQFLDVADFTGMSQNYSPDRRLWDKSRAQTILEYLESSATRGYFDRLGQFIGKDDNPEPLSHGLNDLPGTGTIQSAKRSLLRDGFANRVSVFSSNEDVQFPPAYADITDPKNPAHPNNYGRVVVKRFGSPILPGYAQALKTAQTLLRKSSAVAQQFDVTCVPDSRRDSGDRFPLVCDAGSATVTIQSVTHPLVRRNDTRQVMKLVTA